MYYVRSIKEGKWDDHDRWSMYTFEDLHTSELGLSVWAVKRNRIEDIKEIALAIALTKDAIRSVWLCLIPTDKLKCYKIRIKRSNGDTKYKKLANRHVDIQVPKLKDLLKIHYYLYQHWNQNKHKTNELMKFISQTELEQLFIQKVNDGELDDFIKMTIKNKKEKDYKKYYKMLMGNSHVQAIEASINNNNKNN